MAIDLINLQLRIELLIDSLHHKNDGNRITAYLNKVAVRLDTFHIAKQVMPDGCNLFLNLTRDLVFLLFRRKNGCESLEINLSVDILWNIRYLYDAGRYHIRRQYTFEFLFQLVNVERTGLRFRKSTKILLLSLLGNLYCCCLYLRALFYGRFNLVQLYAEAMQLYLTVFAATTDEMAIGQLIGDVTTGIEYGVNSPFPNKRIGNKLLPVQFFLVKIAVSHLNTANIQFAFLT